MISVAEAKVKKGEWKEVKSEKWQRPENWGKNSDFTLVAMGYYWRILNRRAPRSDFIP